VYARIVVVSEYTAFSKSSGGIIPGSVFVLSSQEYIPARKKDKIKNAVFLMFPGCITANLFKGLMLCGKLRINKMINQP
jgi:hypothetical protein